MAVSKYNLTHFDIPWLSSFEYQNYIKWKFNLIKSW